MYNSIYRPCHVIYSNADPQQLENAIKAVDPDSDFIDGRTCYSYPIDSACLKYDIYKMCTDPTKTNIDCEQLMEKYELDIHKIVGYMNNLSEDSLAEDLASSVYNVLEYALAWYLENEKPELTKHFPDLPYT